MSWNIQTKSFFFFFSHTCMFVEFSPVLERGPERLCGLNERRAVIALNRQGTQSQRPEWPKVPPSGKQLRYINSTKRYILKGFTFEHLPSVEFIYTVFTRMSGGVTVGDSGLSCCVPCLLDAIAPPCLLIQSGFDLF